MTDWMGFGLLILVLVFHTVESEPDRQVVNTTCLELAKPSNQPLRLSCGTPDHYHCLLDETYTMEFEVCRAWKWIPGGKCAYFNTYGQGNVDERMCEQQPSLTLTCSTAGNQFKSSSNTQYTACYVKKATTAAVPTTTSSSPVTDSDNSTSSDLGNIDRTPQRDMSIYVLAIIFGVLVPILTLCGIYVVFRYFKCLHHYTDDPERNDTKKNAASPGEIEQNPLLADENNSGEVKETEKVIQVQICKESKQNDANMLKLNKSENTSGHSERSGNVETSIEESEEKEENKTTIGNAKKTNSDRQGQSCEEVNQVEHMSGHSGQSGNVQTDEKSVEESEENKTTTDTNHDSHSEDEDFHETVTSLVTTPSTTSLDDPDNDHASDNKSTEVFDDTIESLQRDVTTSIGEQEVKLCLELFNLLDNEGLDLIREVLNLVFKRTVGKPLKELLAVEADKDQLKRILPEESHQFFSNQEGNGLSFHVLYGLIQLHSGKEPKSGWGNPVKGSDTGIGDNVERLHRIFTICKEISNPVTVSVDNYARLFDILLPALTKLDSDGELKDSESECKDCDNERKDSGGALREKYKVLAEKLKAIINPSWKQSVHKAVNSFVKNWSPW